MEHIHENTSVGYIVGSHHGEETLQRNMTVVLFTLYRQQDTSPVKKQAPHTFLSSIDTDTYLTSRPPTNVCLKPANSK